MPARPSGAARSSCASSRGSSIHACSLQTASPDPNLRVLSTFAPPCLQGTCKQATHEHTSEGWCAAIQHVVTPECQAAPATTMLQPLTTNSARGCIWRTIRDPSLHRGHAGGNSGFQNLGTSGAKRVWLRLRRAASSWSRKSVMSAIGAAASCSSNSGKQGLGNARAVGCVYNK